LKTYALNVWQAAEQSEQVRADIALAFQTAVVDTMVIKCRRALQQTERKRLVVAGGVGANLALRAALNALVDEFAAEVFYPRHEFCTDNGAMVAYAGYRRLLLGQQQDLSIAVRARWPLSEL